MKPLPVGFTSFLLNNQRMLVAEMYTFQFRNGTLDHYTNLEVPLEIPGGPTFKANGLRIEGLKYKLGVGWQTDEQEITVSAMLGDTLNGLSFFTALESGLLDGGYFFRDRAFWAINDGRPFMDYQQQAVAAVRIFVGRISTVDKLGRTQAQIKVKSPLSLLDIDMPRNTYQPGCNWTLFDQGCALQKSSFTDVGFVVSVIDTLKQTIQITGTFPHGVTGADGLPYYSQGRLLFTSGVNNGLQVSIGQNYTTGGNNYFSLTVPLVVAPAPGDIFSAWPGCSKQLSTCRDKFNNLINFRGFPFVPPIMVSV